MFDLLDLKTNTRLFLDTISPIIDAIASKEIILTDADETISKKDTSRIFCECNKLDNVWAQTRTYFKDLGRNYDGFARVAEVYSNIPLAQYKSFCLKAAKEVEIREHFSNVLLQQKMPIIIATSGLKTLWEYVVKLQKWDNVIVIGGNNLKETPFIVTPEVKDVLSVLLKKKNKRVLAFGDSRVDASMLLNADLGCIVTNERKSPGLVDLVATKSDSIVQLESEYPLRPELQILSVEQVINIFSNPNIKKISVVLQKKSQE